MYKLIILHCCGNSWCVHFGIITWYRKNNVKLWYVVLLLLSQRTYGSTLCEQILKLRTVCQCLALITRRVGPTTDWYTPLEFAVPVCVRVRRCQFRSPLIEYIFSESYEPAQIKPHPAVMGGRLPASAATIAVRNREWGRLCRSTTTTRATRPKTFRVSSCQMWNNKKLLPHRQW